MLFGVLNKGEEYRPEQRCSKGIQFIISGAREMKCIQSVQREFDKCNNYRVLFDLRFLNF